MGGRVIASVRIDWS